jgi:hypothetical protein
VHAFASLQVVPSGEAGFEHTPVCVLQVPATWHWSCAVQTTGLPPRHVPVSQASVRVHALPSLHVVPSGAAGLEHWPVCTLQVPATWH